MGLGGEGLRPRHKDEKSGTAGCLAARLDCRVFTAIQRKGAITMKAREDFRLAYLHPKMIAPVTELMTAGERHIFRVEGTDYRFEPFEGFRHPGRQHDLFTGGKVTKARPWQSAHQYGLAVDFACRVIDQMGQASGWHWPDRGDWEWLKREARRVGLDVPITWDRGHVVHPVWNEYKKYY